ncbi:SHOCT domain-containing protein [Streptomyces sp. NPDC059467]|uniref:SHOCT domain-containing protein n=1 Tax=Streptomyces sp. NPDC059467 TaxID=3346844 RepID=UPI0036975EFD
MTGSGWIVGLMWIWPVFIVAGLLLIGFVVVRLIQEGLTSPPASRSVGSAARRILDERQARGESDEDEYRRRRSLLS